MRRFKPLGYVWILMLVVGLNGCAGFASISESLFLMSIPQEEQLGQKLAQQVEQEMTMVSDPEVVGYIRDLGSMMWRNVENQPVEARFFVVDNPEINAFAIPGGNVYIHTGLINSADDEAELASVIAHECGHVAERHGAKLASRATGMDLLNQILIGQESGQAAQLLSGLISQGIIFRYSRDMEREADYVAVRTMHRAGYDPLALKTFFAELKEQHGDQPEFMAFFATHPTTQSRMDFVTQLVDQLPPKDYARPVTDLRRIQGRLKQLGLVE